MKTKQIFYSLFIIGVLVWSCKKDDGSDLVIIPPRLLTEVVTENADEIEGYLNTHFYNYDEFENPPVDFDYKIKLDTISGDNSDKIPLKQQMESLVINVSSTSFSGLDEEENIAHKLYYLSVRDGVEGKGPTIADSTLLRYEGSLLNGNVFDATPTYQWQYLPFFLRGYANAISMFDAGDNVVVNNDGTSSVTNAGIGLMIIPSGLAYFNASPSGNIPQYSNLIFKVDIGLYVENTDFDNDGIPSILEDLDGDGDLNNDNTDVEQEQDAFSVPFPNHVDVDDDNDGTPTRDEISDDNGNIIIPYPDTDGDGIPDYLDRDNS